MRLWTIQPEDVYLGILETGRYRCDFDKCSMPEFKLQYDWLARQMEKRIGTPPAGITHPVWAWHTYDGKRQQLDLRKIRWTHGSKGEKLVRLEIEIPDEQVLLSDFDAWSIILLDCLIADTEEECDRLEEKYDLLSPDKQRCFKSSNWERVFDIRSLHNGWVDYGDFVQATFWELRREQIINARYFIAAGRAK